MNIIWGMIVEKKCLHLIPLHSQVLNITKQIKICEYLCVNLLSVTEVCLIGHCSWVWAICHRQTDRVRACYRCYAQLLQLPSPKPFLYPHSPSPSCHQLNAPLPLSSGGSTYMPPLLHPNFLTARPDWLSHRDYSVWICLWPMTTRSTSTRLSWPWSAQHWTSRSPRVRKVWNLSYLLWFDFHLSSSPFSYFPLSAVLSAISVLNPETFSSSWCFFYCSLSTMRGRSCV